MPLAGDQSGAGQNTEMRRHGVVGHRQVPRDLAGGQAIRLVLNQQPEDIEPGRLGERREYENGLFWFHMSRIDDIWKCGKTFLSQRSAGQLHAIRRARSRDHAASLGMALSTNRKNRVLRAPATKSSQ